MPGRGPDHHPGLGCDPRRCLRRRARAARPLGQPAKVYRAAGLTPALYASAGRRRDGAISREGSVYLRRALIGLGMGLWQKDPAARAYAAALRERGKPGGIIACALAHRAGKIAFAMHVVLGGWQQGRDPFAGRGDLGFQVAQEG